MKKWYKSKTIIFCSTILVAGGTDLLINFLLGEFNWRSVAILIVSLVGIALRLTTKVPVN